MTIILPKNLSQFRQAFDEACDRIQKSAQDEVFFCLFIQLIVNSRDHSLLKEIIESAEATLLKKQAEFKMSALDVLEYHWYKLWLYHHRSYYHRKDLARIKRVITSPTTIENSSLYRRIFLMMRDFRDRSPFFRCLEESPRIFCKAQSEREIWAVLAHPFSFSEDTIVIQRKFTVIQLNKKNKLLKPIIKIIRLVKNEIQFQFKSSLERQQTRKIEKISSLFSSKALEVEQKSRVPGRNDEERQRFMLIDAEINFSSCWERLQFFEKCYHSPSTFSVPTRISGKWMSIRNSAWQSAYDRCERELLVRSKTVLKENLFHKKGSVINVFLAREYQIHRCDYEKFLNSFKNHIHAHLCTIENEEKKNDANLILPGTLPGDFVVKISKDYWKSHPLAKRDEVFDHYECSCPIQFLLGRVRWDQLVRKHKLDPRSDEEKRKRGPGKKTCKN